MLPGPVCDRECVWRLFLAKYTTHGRNGIIQYDEFVMIDDNGNDTIHTTDNCTYYMTARKESTLSIYTKSRQIKPNQNKTNQNKSKPNKTNKFRTRKTNNNNKANYGTLYIEKGKISYVEFMLHVVSSR